MPESKPKKSELESTEETKKQQSKSSTTKKETAKKEPNQPSKPKKQGSQTAKKQTTDKTQTPKEEQKTKKTATKKEPSQNMDKAENKPTPKKKSQPKNKPKAEPTVNPQEQDAEERQFAQRDQEVIAEELENIKQLVQDEVDKILEKPESGDWKELVKEARQEKLERRTKPLMSDDELCECCGENPKDKSISESYEHCSQCRENMKKYPFSVFEMIMPIIIVALIFLASWQLSQNFGIFSAVAKAQSLTREGKLYSAVSAYEDIENKLKVNDKQVTAKIRENEALLYSKIGFEYYEKTESFINKYYAGKNLDSFRYRKVKAAMDEINDFQTVYATVGTIITSANDYESFIKSFDKAIKEEKDNTFDKGLIEYWKYYAAATFGKSEEVQLKHLKNMEKKSDRYASIYQPALAEMYLNMGEFDNMFKYCDLMQENNKEDVYAYIYRSIAYRLKGDIIKASKYANDGLRSSPSDPDLNHQLSIISLLQGQPKLAQKYAQTAYENATSQYTYLTNANVYALCAHLNNDSETYEAIEEELVGAGSAIADDVIAIIEGKKTIENIFLSGKGDISWN